MRERQRQETETKTERQRDRETQRQRDREAERERARHKCDRGGAAWTHLASPLRLLVPALATTDEEHENKKDR